MIQLKNLEKYFYKGKSNELHVINDITYDFPEHGMVALFGRSGCGKTTLLNVIGGLDKSNSGKVFVSGQPMTASRDELRNKYIGYIFQNYCLNPEETCFDNVAMALRLCGITDEEIIRSRVMKALELVGMKTFYKRLPDSLSGGQQQRIAIARAIVKNSPVILADEPTGNLDETNTIMIMDILKQISKEHLVILVTHEANLVDYYCDEVVELSDGKIAGIRKNQTVDGYIAKDKNTIYLGEYEKQETNTDTVSLSYYGPKPDVPVGIRMINRNGVFYLKIDTPGIHVLDETSEVHLAEGSFEEKKRETAEANAIDMSELGPLEGRNYGRLFRFKDGVKSGLPLVRSRIKNKKSAKRLRKVLVLFAIVFIFILAYLGTRYKAIKDIKKKFNDKAIHVSLDEKNAAFFETEKDPDSKIERIVLTESWSLTEKFSFNLGKFETFRFGFLSGASTSLEVESNVRPWNDIGKVRFIEGTMPEDENTFDIVLTKLVADILLDTHTYEFIDRYIDLIGMTDNSIYLLYEYFNNEFSDINEELIENTEGYEQKREEALEYYNEKMNDIRNGRIAFRIVGIVDSDELAIYVSEDILNGRIAETGFDSTGRYQNAVVYSSDPNTTVKYLKEKFPGLECETAETDFQYEKESARVAIKAMYYVMGVLIAVMGLCMFSIMRSINMNRTKEVGIYRAIGVSKKNMMFRSLIETGVLTTLTVFIGYLLATGVLWFVESKTSRISTLFYYPGWMKLGVLILLYFICLICGSLSMYLILRKTPAEIMAKYDI